MAVSSKDALQQLVSYVEGQEYKGYDPYDVLNSPIKFKSMGLLPSAIAIQIQKRNPINFRPLIGVKKGINPKGIGLFLQSYALRYGQTGDESLKAKADELFQWLIDNPTKGFSGLCWGYNFDWASPKKYLDAYSPTVVVSGFVAKAIFQYYLATKNERAKDALISIGQFVLKDLPLTTDETGICFSYSTVERDICFNASLLGGELMAYLFHLTGEVHYKEKALGTASFALDKQKEDGKWNYSIDIDSGNEREQIDFHQGYVVDSLYQIGKYTESDFSDAIARGMKYYRENQFIEDGRCLWRIPNQWPVDIHNQAQGVISLSRMCHLNAEYLTFAKVIADWTIQNMRSSKGYFHYKKYPTYAIKTPMIRWSQGWMMLALTELELGIHKKEPS